MQKATMDSGERSEQGAEALRLDQSITTIFSRGEGSILQALAGFQLTLPLNHHRDKFKRFPDKQITGVRHECNCTATILTNDTGI